MTAPNQTGTFDALKGHNSDNIRKMLEMAVFLAPYPTAPTLSTITDATGQNLVIPDVYKSVGMTSKDEGATWTPNLDISETGAYGYGAPVRRDAQARALSLGFTMLESKRLVFEVYSGIDLSQVKAPVGKTEVSWAAPSRPDTRYWRCLAIGRDGQGANSIYHVEFLPKVTLTDVSELTWSETDPESYGVTLSAEVDPTMGTAQRTFWAGPGFSVERLTAMGFAQATA